MAEGTGFVGRTTQLYFGDASPSELVAGVREKTVTLEGEAVDVTNDDSSGWRELLDSPQVQAVSISVSGVTVNNTLKSHWFNGDRLQNATFVFADGSTLTGTWYLQEFSETGSHDGEITFEATFMSSGTVTFTDNS